LDHKTELPADIESKPDETAPKKFTRRRFLRWVLTRSALVVPVGGYAYAFEPNSIRVAEVTAKIAGLPKKADGLRIGHISDTHCDSDRAVRRAADAARLLMEQRPDVVFLTGDYISYKPRQRMGPAADALSHVSTARFGAYAVLGNHDWWSGDPYFVAAELKRVGVKVLWNQSAHLRELDLWLVGLQQRCDSLQHPERALKGVPPESVKLLLIHEPDYADEAPPGFALQFSGHSHGGQVRIPCLPPLIVPTYSRRYPEGLRQAKRHQVYTTRGVGMIGPQFRLFCPPEVGLITLRAA
jgi:predicted MPP superfamily phosphohydrolase